MRFLASITLLILLLTGCIAEKPNPENNEWKVSPLFDSSIYTMIGQEGRLGFIYDDNQVIRFFPNKKQKYMWHFWGKLEELQGPLKVIGISKETGEQIIVFNAVAVGDLIMKLTLIFHHKCHYLHLVFGDYMLI